MSREELLQLSCQVVNGILSADSSVLSKAVDRTMHKQIANLAVDIASEIITKIDTIILKRNQT